MEFIAANLFQLSIINVKYSQEIVHSLSCEKPTEKCLIRVCKLCKKKTIKYNLDYEQKYGSTSYEKWVKKGDPHN